MIPIAPDAATSTKHAVDRTSNADREPADASDQPQTIVRLDNQMNVILLHAELDDAEATARGLSESATDDGEDGPRPQAPDGRRRPESNMHRIRRSVLGSALVRHARPTAGSHR